jgi:hypothetical protein
LTSVDGWVSWAADEEAVFLKPGEEMVGYQLVSPGLPGIREFKASPYIGSSALSLAPPTNDLDAIRYERELHEVEDSLTFRGYTVGPTAPPAEFEPVQFLKTIRAYRAAMSRLRWIHDQATSADLEAGLVRT